jgi:hypothetical protein
VLQRDERSERAALRRLRNASTGTRSLTGSFSLVIGDTEIRRRCPRGKGIADFARPGAMLAQVLHYSSYVCSINPVREKRRRRSVRPSMYYALPDEYIRTQMAVGALVLFGVLRVVGAAMGAQYRWRLSTVTRCFIGAAVVFCLPQLIDLLAVSPMSHQAFVELEGKAIGSALALFFAPIVSHKLGYE